MYKERVTLEELPMKLFKHIEHGDQEHRDWLKKELFDWFNSVTLVE